MRLISSLRNVLVALGTVTLAACLDSNAPGPVPAAPGIQAIYGAGVVDTVDAEIWGGLVVEVRDSLNNPISGVLVRFEAETTNGGPYYSSPLILVGSEETIGYGTMTTAITDSRGRAAVRVRLGAIAGAASVKVLAPTLGLTTTVSYTVRPGVASRVVASPRDTALTLGNAATLRSAVADRYGNPISTTVTYTVHGDAVAAEGTAGVRGARYGIAWVVAEAGPGKDSTRVVVVPAATFAASMGSMYYPGAAFEILNSDGSNVRTVSAGAGTYVSTPYWSPDGKRLVAKVTGSLSGLYTLSAAGAADPITLGAGSWPQYSRDGGWVYYTKPQSYSTSRIWRVRPDGTGAEQVSAETGVDGTDQIASLDPTGTKMVFWTNRFGGYVIQIFDFASGVSTPTAASGGYARWSPRGDRIAVADLGGISILDATGALLAHYAQGNPSPVDWSPDGNWIVATGYDGIFILEVSTGLALPIPGTRMLSEPTWKP